ncbi:alpha-ketoglutarate-dependent dioxygenase AlkB family protein [Marinibactrum halimedae]|uniref:Alkylated DNA repair protein n=1 Tax=Marinibactrum halimedae TaxID=1444977 RepID=A0AA37T447_9GAMM|nr:alpha-ketoglutarate-dependent dioxygenase AlkB [Marinibactrum halimedae]MCD9460047.1 alpha-ketoglutarate-dependent dioxygenase AlkB [Marinibactrum halimedae]GLS26445.1 alkylated DNA repair protein [Marinibactrum halimedae]
MQIDLFSDNSPNYPSGSPSKSPSESPFDSLSDSCQKIELTDGELVYCPDWLSASESTDLYRVFSRLAWQQSQIRMMGQYVTIPRLNAWYGDLGANYGYSGVRLPLNTWTSELRVLREQLLSTTGCRFNSVLANWYRSGQDSVSWHSDDEPELGENPVIASVSLGETRRFQLRHKTKREIETVALDLASGSLLLMLGKTQTHWQHQIPKTKRIIGGRINLTFRNIVNNEK